MLHVADRIDVDQRTYPRNNHQHQQRELVDLKRKRNMQLTYIDPVKERNDLWYTSRFLEGQQHGQRSRKATQRGQRADQTSSGFGNMTKSDTVDQKADQRQQGYENK